MIIIDICFNDILVVNVNYKIAFITANMYLKLRSVLYSRQKQMVEVMYILLFSLPDLYLNCHMFYYVGEIKEGFIVQRTSNLHYSHFFFGKENIIISIYYTTQM
jgi:hypothetical protein